MFCERNRLSELIQIDSCWIIFIKLKFYVVKHCKHVKHENMLTWTPSAHTVNLHSFHVHVCPIEGDRFWNGTHRTTGLALKDGLIQQIVAEMECFVVPSNWLQLWAMRPESIAVPTEIWPSRKGRPLSLYMSLCRVSYSYNYSTLQ